MQNHKGSIAVPVLVIAVIVAGLLAGGSWWYAKQQDEKAANTNTVVVVNENVNSVVATNENANTNTVVNGNTNVAVNGNTNSASNVNVNINAEFPIANDWESYHVGGMDKWVFYKKTGEKVTEIKTPFDLSKYHGTVTMYGAIFWKQGETRKANSSELGGFSYEYGTDPDFQFYNFTEQKFSLLPKLSLVLSASAFERIQRVYPSSTEPKVVFEVGEFDTSSREFIPGFADSQPVKSHGVVYNFLTGKYETEDPLTTYLEVLQIPSPYSAGGGYGFNWDSKAKIAVAVSGGEGCGAYDTLQYVNLVARTNTKVGGPKSFTFADDTCNPRNGVSQDGKWFSLIGKSTTGDIDVYLFTATSYGQPIKRVLGIPNINEYTYLVKWDLSGAYPIITLSTGQVINFNTGQVKNVHAIAFKQKGKTTMLGEPIDVTYDNKYLYIANGWRGVEIFSVQNPAATVRVAAIPPSEKSADNRNAEVNSVDIRGSYAFVTDNALRVVDISNPRSPKVLATAIGITNPWVEGAALYGNYAYVVVDGGVRGVNATDPENLRTFDVTAIPFEASNDLLLDGDRLYVRGSQRVDVLSVKTPEMPTLLGSYTVAKSEEILKQIIVDGKLHVFVAGQTKAGKRPANVKVLNVVNPAQIRVVDSYSADFLKYSYTGAFFADIIFEGKNVYVARQNGIEAYDVTNFDAPKQIGRISVSDLRQMVKVENIIYAAASNYDTGGYLYSFEATEIK